MGWTVRAVRGKAVLAAVALALAAAPRVRAADLEIVSTGAFESNGHRYLEPCVRNNSGQLRSARFKVGGGAIRWTFPPIPIPPGKTVCRALDAPQVAPGVANEIHLE